MDDQEYKKAKQKLEAKLKKHPPTDEQREYYAYSIEYAGYEFRDLKTGNIYSKFDIWIKAGRNRSKANSLISGHRRRFKKQLKADWQLGKFGVPEPKTFPRKF